MPVGGMHNDARTMRLLVHVRGRYLVRMYIYIYIYEEVDVSLVGNRGQWP